MEPHLLWHDLLHGVHNFGQSCHFHAKLCPGLRAWLATTSILHQLLQLAQRNLDLCIDHISHCSIAQIDNGRLVQLQALGIGVTACRHSCASVCALKDVVTCGCSPCLGCRLGLGSGSFNQCGLTCLPDLLDVIDNRLFSLLWLMLCWMKDEICAATQVG